MLLAAEPIVHVVLQRVRHAGAALPVVWDRLEHVPDARPVPRVHASLAVDIVSQLRRMVAPRRLVRGRSGSADAPRLVQQSVEQHAKRAERLASPLRAESEQHDVTGIELHVDGGRLSSQVAPTD